MNADSTPVDPRPRVPPSIRYRGVPEPTVVSDGELPAVGEERPTILRWLDGGIHLVVLAVWAVLGFVVWVPVLLREMVRFSLALVPATLQGRSPRSQAERLAAATDFYRRGFLLAAEGVRGRSGDSGVEALGTPIAATSISGEFGWVVLFWYAVLALAGAAWSPFELGRWIGALPWGEWSSGIGAVIVEPFL